MNHVVSGLLAKRAEIAGVLQDYKAKINTLEQEILHLDGAIKVFDPSISLETLKPRKYRKRNNHFKTGECPRLVLDTLREAGSALTKHDISSQLIDFKSLQPTPDNSHSVQSAVHRALISLEKKALVERITQEGTSAMSWRIA